jgi:hypothetical protein
MALLRLAARGGIAGRATLARQTAFDCRVFNWGDPLSVTSTSKPELCLTLLLSLVMAWHMAANRQIRQLSAAPNKPTRPID